MLPIPDSNGRIRTPSTRQADADDAIADNAEPVTSVPEAQEKYEPVAEQTIDTETVDDAADLRAQSAATSSADEEDTASDRQYSYDGDFSFGDGDAIVLDDDGDESDEEPIIIDNAEAQDMTVDADDAPAVEDIQTNDSLQDDSTDDGLIPEDEAGENPDPENDDSDDSDEADGNGSHDSASDYDDDASPGLTDSGDDHADDADGDPPGDDNVDDDSHMSAWQRFRSVFSRKASAHDAKDDDAEGLGAKFKDFTARLKSEIGQGDDEPDDGTPEHGQGLAAEPDESRKRREPDDQPGNGKRGRSHHPLRRARDLFFKVSRARRRLYIICSIIACLLGVWTVPNLHAAFSPSSSSFDENEGTVKVADPKYADNHVSFKATNDSDMIAHISVKGMVKAWSPRPMWPSSLFAPRTVMGCGETSMDINPGESKTITMECHGGDGIWKRPAIEVISG